MKAIKYLSMLLMMVALSVSFTSCDDGGEKVPVEEPDQPTTCTVINQVSGITLRDVNAIHVNSKREEIKSEYIGDIPYGSSKTFQCLGAAVYFRLNFNGKVCFTADVDLKAGENNTFVIDDNTYVYQ